MNGQQDLTVGKPFGTILRFAVPVIGGSLFQLFYTLADTMIVGRTLGADALAAVGSTTTIIYFILCFIQGFTGGLGICLGQRCGARDEAGMRRSTAVSLVLCVVFTVLVTGISCAFTHPILAVMKTPEEIYDMAFAYLFTVLAGTGATIYYNIISNLMRSLGDSRTPLVCLVFSSLLNIVLDILFIVPFGMGVTGAALATVLSQLLSAVLCTWIGLRSFEVLRVRKSDFYGCGHDYRVHLKLAFPMGFQMSVMCIGQLAMQAAVNALGPAAIAGYTAATKADQVSVLINNAMGIALSNYVAQNYGARLIGRIRQGVNAALLQTETANVLMCVLMIVCRNMIVPVFVDQPTAEIIHYSNGYILVVAPFYVILGLLMTYRTAIQSMGNGTAPFIACMIELFMRIAAAMGLAMVWGYYGVCFASPLAWIGATSFLIPVYYAGVRKLEGKVEKPVPEH